MRKLVVGILAASLIFTQSNFVFAANAMPSKSCFKINSVVYQNLIKFKCIKIGKKLKWDNGQPIIFPSGFNDLVSKRDGISRSAWQSINKSTNPEDPIRSSLDNNVGPNTVLRFNKLEKIIGLVSSSFNKYESPAKILAISYNYKDLNWATELLKSKVSPSEFAELDRNEGGHLIDSNCQNGNCLGSKQITSQSGLAIILLGISNSLDSNDPTASYRFLQGQLEAHEYFHSMQRIPLLGKPLTQETYPPIWFTEGSAEWVQNASVNYDSYENYSKFRKLDCQSACANLKEADISKFLATQTSASAASNFERFLNYNLGSLVVETLVAIGGHNSILEIHKELGTGIGWNAAFKNTFGVDWKLAYPVIAKSVAGNIKEFSNLIS